MHDTRITLNDGFETLCHADSSTEILKSSHLKQKQIFRVLIGGALGNERYNTIIDDALHYACILPT
jgi:hypothetical protein